MAANIQILTAGQGYGIVIGLGIGFVLIMIGLTLIQNKFTSMDSFKSEEFNVASRTIKPGLIASGIISAWTHPGTFLNACTLAYKYGVAGPMWIGANGAFQILFFALAAIKLKRVANTAHTFPGIQARLLRSG
jgi:Na+/proline symporter